MEDKSMKNEFTYNIKALYKERYKLVVILNLIAIVIALFLGYNKLQPTEEEKVFIFMSGSLNLNLEITEELTDICSNFGMKEFLAMGYDENDVYFNQSVSTKGYYGSDLFLFSYEVAESFKGMELYAPLDSDYLDLSEDYFYEEDNPVGLKINENYYVFVAAKCEKDRELIYELLKYIVSKGGEIGE